MADKNVIEYFLNDDYSFTVSLDKMGRKVGKLVNLKNNEIIADDFMQRVLPENLTNLLNVAKIVINAAWQDGKILPEEREAFNKAFENVNFSDSQKIELEKELKNPTPIEELIKNVSSREEKLLILETSLLLVFADNEFHPKERAFIEYLCREFDLDKDDYALLYRILPERVKKYIIREKLNEGLKMRPDEIEVLNKFVPENKVEEIKHEHVYRNLMSNWKNRRIRYSRPKSY